MASFLGACSFHSSQRLVLTLYTWVRVRHDQASRRRRYAWECQTQEGGWGLDGILREQSWKLRGIVNGIDYSEWSPQVCVGVQHLGRTCPCSHMFCMASAMDESSMQRGLESRLGSLFLHGWCCTHYSCSPCRSAVCKPGL